MSHSAEKDAPEIDYCDYCGEPTSGPEEVIACDGWTCRPDDEDDL